MQPVTAEIKIPVAQADIFGVFLIAENGHGQFIGRRLDSELADINLDTAGRQVGIYGLLAAGDHLAGDGDDAFRTNTLHSLEIRHIMFDHALGNPVMVAQIDKQQIAMIALAMNPARQADGFANITLAQISASMGAVAMHDTLLSFGSSLIAIDDAPVLHGFLPAANLPLWRNMGYCRGNERHGVTSRVRMPRNAALPERAQVFNADNNNNGRS